jgi:hypothetical protein
MAEVDSVGHIGANKKKMVNQIHVPDKKHGRSWSKSVLSVLENAPTVNA